MPGVEFKEFRNLLRHPFSPPSLRLVPRALGRRPAAHGETTECLPLKDAAARTAYGL